EFAYAPSGIPGVETMLPLLFPYLKHNKLPLERLVNAVSEQPSLMFGLNKGYLEEGRDADLIVVDLRQETEIKGDELHSKCGWTPYEGMTAIFPRMVMVRGEIIVKDDNLEGERGWGKFQR
ncbi:MAG: amidohydrolase family protein, partial [Thermoplasmata archaeon]|nr:amidohydrolase family protein [Thermoplasmata archaeon]